MYLKVCDEGSLSPIEGSTQFAESSLSFTDLKDEGTVGIKCDLNCSI